MFKKIVQFILFINYLIINDLLFLSFENRYNFTKTHFIIYLILTAWIYCKMLVNSKIIKL